MNIKSSRGLTLVEMMIAMLISLILMAGVLTIMSSSKRTYALQSELSALQDNARFVIGELTRELRMAGYGGCSNINQQPFVNLNVNNQIIRDDNGNNISIAVPNSDKLIVTANEVLEYLPTQIFNNNNTSLTLDIDSNFLPSAGTNINVVDCVSSSTYNITSVTENSTNTELKLNPALVRSYSQPIEVLFQYVAYYEICYSDEIGFGLYKGIDKIGATNGTICDENEGTAMTGSKELIVEGVENMQIRYGIDINNDNIPDRYSMTPTNGTPISVRVTLLMRTIKRRFDLVGSTNKTFILDPQLSYNPDSDAQEIESGYRHRLFTTTIAIRNNTI